MYHPLYNFLEQLNAFKFQHRNRFVVRKRNKLSGIGRDVYFDSISFSSAEARTAVDLVSCAFYRCLPYVSCPRAKQWRHRVSHDDVLECIAIYE